MNEDTGAVRPRWRMIGTLFLIIGGVIVVAIVVSLTQVEDWSRDLAQNRACTSMEATDESLRTLETDVSVEEALDAVRRAAASLPRWSEATVGDAADPATLAFVRTTLLMRYRDDVVITVRSVDGKTRIDGVSQSRVGKGDLGQNPRNLREILLAIHRELGHAPGS